MEAIKSLKKTVIPAGRSFQRSHPHSPGEVACPGAGRQRTSGQKELNNTCMSCTTKLIKNFKQYELSWREQTSKQDTHYRDSDKYQGVKPCNQQGKGNTTGVREHPGLQGVRDYTDQANARDCNWSPVYSPGPTHPSPGMYPDRSTMDSTDEVGHSPNSSRTLLQLRLCR